MMFKTEKNIERVAVAFYVLTKAYDVVVFSAVTYVVFHFICKFW